MKPRRIIAFTLLLTVLLTSLVFLTTNTPVRAISWTAKWIWQSVDGPANTWMCFRKTFNLSAAPASAIADIAVDSKYWMWINGNLAVFEGGLKRGPTPNDSYYDEVDLRSYLTSGANTIAILVWHWGKDGFSHKNSTKGGLLFEANIDGTIIKSDNTWKMKVHPAYGTTSTSNPNYRLAEHNVKFDARNDNMGSWTAGGYDDSTWSAPTEKGSPPVAPWNNLWLRPIPQWKNSGIVSYTNEASFPATGNGSAITAKLPYNAQVTPYLQINAPSAGLTIDIRTDNYTGGGENNVRAEYITKAGIQEFESLGWMNGHEVRYTIPSGVQIIALKYRETGYNTTFAGSFSCNDSFYNNLWEKAKRTLYVTMRDNYFDCPDRERAQWWGDAVIEIGESFYALDINAHALAKKGISNLVEWQRADKTLFSPVPAGNWNSELPVQMLASIGQYGFWTYYMYTGDIAAMSDAYDDVRDYLTVWTLDADGLVNHRAGNWDWEDWGSNIDARVLDNAWYYLALKSVINMATLTGNTADLAGYNSKKASIENNFNRVLWNGTEYRSPGYTSDTDDRGNGLAVVAGLADSAKWPAIKTVLLNHTNASPYMEKYVLEALYLMGYQTDALTRMKNRYTTMVNDATCTTLWELWTKGGSSTYNHAWTGGPLTLLCQYGAGVAPETAGFGTYHVFPQEGSLTSISTVVPSIKGNISVAISKNSSQYGLNLTSPANTTAIVGIPEDAFRGQGNALGGISVNGTTIWQNGSYLGGVTGISYNGEDSKYCKFNANPGTWNFLAVPGAAATPTPTPTPSLTPTPTPTAMINFALNKTVNARCSLESTDWGKAKMVDGQRSSVSGSKGYTSDPWQTSANNNEWVEIDMGSNQTFTQVKMYPRTDTPAYGGGSANFPVDFTIQVKPNGGSYTTVKTVTGQANPNGVTTYDLGTQTARYVLVNVTKLGTPASDESSYYRLQLAEVEIFNVGGATPTPTPSPTPALFTDGFESNNFTAGGWTNSGCTIGSTYKYAGTYAAIFNSSDSLTKAVSTAGYQNIQVKYARYTRNCETDDHLIAEWYNGSAWTAMEDLTGNSSWTLKTWTLPAGANNNANFQIRFRTSHNASNDYAYLDEVQVTGKPQ